MRAIAFILTFTCVLGVGALVPAATTAPNAGLFKFDAAPAPVAAPVIIASR